MRMSREIRLRSRPTGAPTAEDFELASVSVGEPGAGEVLVRNLWMSVDPSMRARMDAGDSYVAAYALGEAMLGGAVGEVLASGDPTFLPGDLVLSRMGWREAFVCPAASLTKLPAGSTPPQAHLGILGMTGFTAYVGLLKVAALRPGDVVFVSAAAGAVGAVVCQIAKLKGHTVIASAGGERKAVFLRDELKVDAVIDYRAVDDLTEALARAAPDGVDVYFDNVGGSHLEAALACARDFGRFAICGMIADYNARDRAVGPRNLLLTVTKRLRLQGFIQFDHAEEFPAFQADMARWMASGQVKSHETVFEGIEQAPEALFSLFTGGNLGKALVRL